MKGQMYAIPVLIIIAAVLALVLTSQTPQSVACTEEAKLCPDGSYVERTGPNCEFVPCPSVQTKDACEDGGGEWKMFSTGCHDECEIVRSTEPVKCTQAFSEGCDCGPDKCWNGGSCEPN